MKKKRLRALILGGLIMGLMVAFPPYYETGGLIGGICFGSLWSPLEWDPCSGTRYTLATDAWILQIVAVACFTLSKGIIHAEGSTHRARIVWKIGVWTVAMFALVSFFVVTPYRMYFGEYFLLNWAPIYFNPGYLLFWLRACALGLLLLVSLWIVDRRYLSIGTNSMTVAVASAAFALLLVFCGLTSAQEEWRTSFEILGLTTAACGAVSGWTFSHVFSRLRQKA